MSKKFLGLICILYSFIFGYVTLFDKLKNFLAPTMQIYIKLSLIPMFIIGLVLLFSKKIHYKFKITDLVLILPLILLITAGDGKLTTAFATNRSTNINIKRTKSETKKTTSKEVITNKKKNKDEKLYVNTDSYDFSNPYFDIIDESYNELSGYITFSPKSDKFEGKTIRVKGFAVKKASYLPKGYFALGKYIITCCAADANFAGFIAKYDTSKIKENNWYEIEGIIEKGTDNEGYDIMYINVINIKEINSMTENQYIYPCYAYGDGTCEVLSKYNLEY